jgi:predicted nucleic acid-binding protein
MPLRNNQAELLARYDQFFTRRTVVVAAIAPAVIERATDLRIRYRLKTPDAIHLATALESGADAVLTGDRDFSACREIKIDLI